MSGPLKNGRSAVCVPGDPDLQQTGSTSVGRTDARGATATSATVGTMGNNTIALMTDEASEVSSCASNPGYGGAMPISQRQSPVLMAQEGLLLPQA
jgi:hypothetical protein